MASLKEVRNRIASVNSTMQITKAMKMVAAAKLRRAQDKIVQLRPYAQRLNDLIGQVSQNTEVGSNSPFTQVRDIEKVLVVLVSSDRGLCGAFNSNVIKAAVSYIDTNYSGQNAKGNVTIMPIGKKGFDSFKRRDSIIDDTFLHIFSDLSFDTVKSASEQIMNAYAEGKYDEVVVIYNQFKNVATQVIQAEKILPLAPDESNTPKSNVDYIFEPSEEEILLELIPKAINLQLFKAVLDSNASEHGARMTAMDKATDNGNEMLKDLRVQYNRSRQAAITTEILEIVGGAEALKNG